MGNYFNFGNPPTQPGTVVLLRSIIVNGEHHKAGSEVRLSPAVLSKMTLGEDYKVLGPVPAELAPAI